jgi:hypothetical protein
VLATSVLDSWNILFSLIKANKLTSAMALEKYRELFTFSNALLKDEHDRFNRIDEKAVRYLSAVTLLIGVEGSLGKEILSGLIPPADLLQWLLLNIAVLSFLMLVATWFVIFQTLRIAELKTPPLNQQMIDFFDINKEINIYYSLAKANAEAWEVNRQTTDRKAKALYYGYQMIIGTVCLFVIFICLYFGQAWSTVPGVSKGDKSEHSLDVRSDSTSNAAPSSPVVSPAPHEVQPKAMIGPDHSVKSPDYIFIANEREHP